MSPLALAAAWGGAGALGVPALSALGLGRRALAVLPLALGLLTLLSASEGAWPGPASSNGYGANLVLGRPGLGLLAVAGGSFALACLLAPAVEAAEVAVACLVGAAAVVVLSATAPVVWAMAAAMAVGVLAVRWITAAPGRATLATGRIAGMGAATLLAATAFLPGALGPVGARTTMGGALLAAGAGCLLALVPLGGWAAGGAGAVRGTDLGLWTLLLAPALLFSAGAALPSLPPATLSAFATDLLVLALLSGVYSGVQAVRARPESRYGRLWIADLALAAAGLATLHDAGRLGGMLIVLSHLIVGPMLLHAPRPGLERQHRLAWLALAGLPGAVGFWGRLMVLQALAETSGPVLVIGLATAAAATAAAVRGLTGDQSTAGRPAALAVRLLAGAVCLAALVAGLAPASVAEHVFGVSFV